MTTPNRISVRNASVNSVERTSHDLVRKYTEQPLKFAYYEHFVATPPMRQPRRASSIVNRILIVLIILTCGFLLYEHVPITRIVEYKKNNKEENVSDYKNNQKFTQIDRACIQDEWQENQSLDNTSDFSDTYRISFSDIQKSFKWIHTPKLTESPEILMIISSNCDNFARRNVLRKTWISSEKNQIIGDGRMKVLFLVGVASKNEKLNTVVLEEARVFGDMIVVDLEDIYVNLPFKSITLLLYGVSKTPSSVKMIGKIDEDVIFFPDQLVPIINKGTINMSTFSIYGEKWEAGVDVNHREDAGKWYVSKNSFKCMVYPSYLSGPFYLVTRKAAERVISATKHRKYISTNDWEKFEITAWHTKKNNDQYVESWERMRTSRCKGCSRIPKNFRGSRSQYGEKNQ
uniref:Hexosyltransferase n=1 Tax=Caenorhabditis tropicalis TaxID=1561998 RepID=A0A1I7U3J0_9PELO